MLLLKICQTLLIYTNMLYKLVLNFLSGIYPVQVGSQSILLVFEPSETAEKRLYLNVYSCIWRGRWFCNLSHTYPHHHSIVWPVQTFRSGRFSAILGYFSRFWWGNGYPRRFWWRNGSEMARPKCASSWISGPFLWAAAARTTAPSCGRFSADPLSKIQIF
jgi:hypothetical protein